jgi:hypothetical protein
MNKDITLDLNIQIDEFEKQKKQAQKRFNETYKSDDQDSVYLWEDLILDTAEESVDGNDLKISGNMKTSKGEDLGWITLVVPLDFEKLIEIFQSYIKKLNKVKSVMESVKDE